MEKKIFLWKGLSPDGHCKLWKAPRTLNSTHSRGRQERGKNRVSFILSERMALNADASNDGNVNRVSRNHLGASIEEFRSNCTVLCKRDQGIGQRFYRFYMEVLLP